MSGDSPWQRAEVGDHFMSLQHMHIVALVQSACLVLVPFVKFIVRYRKMRSEWVRVSADLTTSLNEAKSQAETIKVQFAKSASSTTPNRPISA